MDGPTRHKPGLKLIFGGFNLPDSGLGRHRKMPRESLGHPGKELPCPVLHPRGLACWEAMTASALHPRCLNRPFPVWVSLVIRVSYHCPSHAQNKPTPFPYACVHAPRLGLSAPQEWPESGQSRLLSPWGSPCFRLPAMPEWWGSALGPQPLLISWDPPCLPYQNSSKRVQLLASQTAPSPSSTFCPEKARV